MTGGGPQSKDGFTLYALGNLLLRKRRRIVWSGVVGGVIAAAIAFLTPPKFVSSASFIPQGSDVGRSGLASLAGQLGVALPTSNSSQSPDFYVRLLRSRVLLERIARDTLTVEEIGGRRVPFLALFAVEGEDDRARLDEGVRLLTKIVTPSIVKLTGIIEVSARTRWPSVSRSIVTRLVQGVDEFNQNTRRAQAAAERQFVEARLSLANADLRVAEDRLERFLAANRQFASSPELTFQRERLQRDMSVKQQVSLTLIQAYEDVRIREVRDTPVISVLEPPSTPSASQPRHLGTVAIAGLLLGAFCAIVVSLLAEGLRVRRAEGNVDAEALSEALGQVANGVRQRLRLTHRARESG